MCTFWSVSLSSLASIKDAKNTSQDESSITKYVGDVAHYGYLENLHVALRNPHPMYFTTFDMFTYF